LVVSYDFVGHRQAQPDGQQQLAILDNYHLTLENARFHLIILHGHLWGGRFQMAVIGERQVTGGNGMNPSGQEGWISSEYGRFLAM
jgi:hypothetical protein